MQEIPTLQNDFKLTDWHDLDTNRIIFVAESNETNKNNMNNNQGQVGVIILSYYKNFMDYFNKILDS